MDRHTVTRPSDISADARVAGLRRCPRPYQTPAGRSETGLSPRAVDPGFMAFRLVGPTRTVMLMVQVWLDSGFWNVPPGRDPSAKRERRRPSRWTRHPRVRTLVRA